MADRARMNNRRSHDPSMDELEERVAIDHLDLMQSIIEQPELFYRVAKRLAFVQSDRDALKQALSEAEARAQIEIHEADEALPETAVVPRKVKRKRTVAEIEALVSIDPDVLGLKQQLLRVSRVVAAAATLKEGYLQRKSSLSDAVALRGQAGSPIDFAADRREVAEMRKAYAQEKGK